MFEWQYRKAKGCQICSKGENSMDAEHQMERELGLQLRCVYGSDIFNPEFMVYLETIPDLFKLYEFEQANHPDFKKFLVGIPRLINLMGQGVIN